MSAVRDGEREQSRGRGLTFFLLGTTVAIHYSPAEIETCPSSAMKAVTAWLLRSLKNAERLRIAMKRSVVRDPDLLARGLEALYRNLDQHYGPVPLLMLLALVPGIEDYWNLVVSAKGLDQLSRATAIGMAVDVLRESLPKKTWPGIGRVSVLHTDDPFVRGINRLKRINQLVAGEDLALHLEGLIVSGVEVSEAIVLQQPKTV